MLDTVLDLYDTRIKVLSLNYLVSKAKSKFECFSDEESYSLSVQLLDFIMQHSFQHKSCFKVNIYDFTEKLNEVVYKKDLNRDEIEEVVDDLIGKLRSKGKVFHFNTYNNKLKRNVAIPIRLISTSTAINPEGEESISYSLTELGYRFLLGTKEYDDLLGMEISRIVAQLKIKNGDYDGTMDMISQIKNVLQLQIRKIVEFNQKLNRGIAKVDKDEYEHLTKKTLDVILKEKDSYRSLRNEVLHIIKNQEELGALREEGEDSDVREAIKSLGVIVSELSSIEALVWKVIEGISHTESKYEKAILSSLQVIKPKMLDFENTVLVEIERDVSNLEAFEELNCALFGVKRTDIYRPDTPYLEQPSLVKEIEDTSTELDAVVEIDSEQRVADEELLLKNETFFADFFEALFLFKLKKGSITLKDFFNHLLENDKSKYFELTSDAKILRDVLMFIHDNEEIAIKDMLEAVKEVDIKATEVLDMQRVCLNLIDRGFDKLHLMPKIRLSLVRVGHNEDTETINIKTEIDLTEMTFTELSFVNCIID